MFSRSRKFFYYLKMINLIYLIILIKQSIEVNIQKECCLLNGSYSINIDDITLIDNFNDLNQLNFNCSKMINLSFLELKPLNKIILNDSLILNDLTIKPVKDQIFSVMFNNFKGFDIQSNSFKKIKFIDFNLNQTVWNIKNSYFDFYFKETNLNNYCNESLNISTNFFSSSYIIVLHDTTRYSDKTCPLLFKNYNLIFFGIKISSTFIYKNELKFQNLSNDFLTKHLNSSILHFEITLFHSSLSTHLMNKHIFKKLNVLDLIGQIRYIQDDLFKSFNDLKILRFRMQSIKSLFTQNNKWLNYLNYNKTDRDLNSQFSIQYMFLLNIYQTFENVTFYDYPEKDFCLFENFPHKRLVLPHLQPDTKSTCSCTQLYLIQYSYKYSSYLYYYLGEHTNLVTNYYQYEYYSNIDIDTFSKCINYSIETVISKCNFNNRINKCQIKEAIKEDSKFYFYVNDWHELSKYSKLIISVYLNPVFSFLCFISNVLLIFVISNNNFSIGEYGQIYKFLKINSYLNICYILILASKLIINCDFEDLFCSQIHNSVYVQYYNIFVIKLIGNILQTASNITQLTSYF